MMAEKKKFLLRIDKNLYQSLEKWSSDELRSINGQIEFLLMKSVKEAGRTKPPNTEDPPNPPEDN
jgi:hypothetical protein